MKAVVCTGYGRLDDVVGLRDMPLPAVGPGDALIEVHAAGVNPIDLKIAQGALKAIRKFPLPFVMGYDLSGVVVETGSAVTRFRPGDAVFARVDSWRFGTFAEFAAVSAGLLAPKPAAASHVEAASLPLVGLTAWQALSTVAAVRPGHAVLIHAGAGGVGSVAIQLAKVLGARVTATTSGRNVAFVAALGADQVLDYTRQAYDEVLSGFDVVLDTLGGEHIPRSLKVLKRGGVLVSIVGMPSGQWARAQGLPFFMPWLMDLANLKHRRQAATRGVRFEPMMLEPAGDRLGQLGALVDEGRLRPVIDRVFPLAQAMDALRHSQSGRARGKVVIGVRAAARVQH